MGAFITCQDVILFYSVNIHILISVYVDMTIGGVISVIIFPKLFHELLYLISVVVFGYGEVIAIINGLNFPFCMYICTRQSLTHL